MKRWSLKNILKELALTLIMIFVLSMGLNYLRQPDSTHQPKPMKVKLIDGKEVNLYADHQVTIIHFWATWCPTCKLEAPNIERIQKDVHLITVAVNSGSDQELANFMTQEGYHYPVVNDREGLLAKKFDVGVFPTTFIYDKNGLLKFSEVGYSTTLGLKARIELIE